MFDISQYLKGTCQKSGLIANNAQCPLISLSLPLFYMSI